MSVLKIRDKSTGEWKEIQVIIGAPGKDGDPGADGEDGNTYLCQRTGEAAGGTIVLQYMPYELVGQYFEEVTA